MAKLQNALPEIQKVIDGFSGNLAFKIVDEQTGDFIEHNPDALMATASTIKVYCLGALLELVDQNKLSLDDMVELTTANQARGSGILKELTLGTKYTVRDVCMLMIVLSDNTATNMVIDLCGGVDAVNAHMAAHGIVRSRLNNRIDFKTVIAPTDLGVSCPVEFVDYLQRVYDGKVLSPQLREEYLRFLSHQQYIDMFPRYLPYCQYASDLSADTKQDMQVYNKTGFMTTVRVDVGYITFKDERVTYAVFSDECSDESFWAENEANIALGRIGQAVYNALWA